MYILVRNSYIPNEKLTYLKHTYQKHTYQKHTYQKHTYQKHTYQKHTYKKILMKCTYFLDHTFFRVIPKTLKMVTAVPVTSCDRQKSVKLWGIP